MSVPREAYAFVAWDDVEVRIEDRLSAGRAVIMRDDDAIGLKRLGNGLGYAMNPLQVRADDGLIQLQEILRLHAFRRDQCMPARLREEIHERQYHVVFVDLHARRLAAQNLG